MPIKPALSAGLLLSLALGGPLKAADAPLSAIDWLSKSVTTPAGPVGKRQPNWLNEPPVASGGALPEAVATTSLDKPALDAIGLISPEVSGLPADLWGAGLTEEIAAALTRSRAELLPAMQQLLLTMLLAEAQAPIDNGNRGLLLLARVDKLMALGALEQAKALLDIAGPVSPELFRRTFDAAILTGDENTACQQLEAAPGLAPTLPTRVFCLARGGEWDAAALTLNTARALGQVSPDQADLLSRFLDPELYEEEALPALPNPVTPLDWKIYEAIGETLPTSALPVAFAYAELSPNAGWKAQLEAAERLTRAGTIAPNVLYGLYTERRAAASGGVWERVAHFQSFDTAMASGNLSQIEAALPAVWQSVQEAEIEVPFAFLYGERLIELPLSPEAAKIAAKIALLSPKFKEIALATPPALQVALEDPQIAFLSAIARGRGEGATPADRLSRALLPAFINPTPSKEASQLLTDNRLGEAILQAIEEIDQGLHGDLSRVTKGLSLLRLVGLEAMARRIAIEVVVLERRG